MTDLIAGGVYLAYMVTRMVYEYRRPAGMRPPQPVDIGVIGLGLLYMAYMIRRAA